MSRFTYIFCVAIAAYFTAQNATRNSGSGQFSGEWFAAFGLIAVMGFVLWVAHRAVRWAIRRVRR